MASHEAGRGVGIEYLRKDPVAAAAHLHIALDEEDIDYLTNVVDWDRLAELAEPVRGSLTLERVTHSW